ncbi:bacterial transcriptional activator domain-containing protein [Kitasatospora sp. NPDC058965]|uniref:bacterial transcriptional activator domain-containing protein n=1 Tax=Kitasatospora sp. NPDC058965 TaxID=3346682 RepID=UPI0036B11080
MAEPARAANGAHAPTFGIQLPGGAGYLALPVAVALSAAAIRRSLRRRRDYQLDDLPSTPMPYFYTAARRAGTAPSPDDRAAAHRRTVELYRGDLCTGLDRPWLTAPREDARRRVLHALATLVGSTDDPEEKLGLLERALDHDPYNEQLHLRLASQHLALGRTEAVRRIQERLRVHLAEIDERPTPGTVRAFQDLLSPAHPNSTRASSPRPGLTPGNRGTAGSPGARPR